MKGPYARGIIGRMWKPIKLPYKELPGFSAKLIADHHKLYTGYLDRLAKIRPAVRDFNPRGDKFELQRLALEEGFLRNAARLHELYFGNLTPGGAGSPADALGDDYEGMLDAVALMGAGSTGWVILAHDLVHGGPVVFTMRDHFQGYVAETWPLLVLDVYEHAYLTDYRLRKDEYITAFFENVDWNEVGTRAERASAMEMTEEAIEK